MDSICKYENLDELYKKLKDKVWTDIDTFVTPGLSKEEYVQFFEKMLEKNNTVDR